MNPSLNPHNFFSILSIKTQKKIDRSKVTVDSIFICDSQKIFSTFEIQLSPFKSIHVKGMYLLKDKS